MKKKMENITYPVAHLSAESLAMWTAVVAVDVDYQKCNEERFPNMGGDIQCLCVSVAGRCMELKPHAEGVGNFYMVDVMEHAASLINSDDYTDFNDLVRKSMEVGFHSPVTPDAKQFIAAL